MNLTHLRVFHTVATERSFTRAAQALRVSQPTISEQIKTMEDTYGVRLLDRRKGGIVPTEIGQTLLDKTRDIFRLEDEAEQMLEQSLTLQSGHLKIGTDGPRHVVPLLARFLNNYPGIDISMSTGNARKVLRSLHDYSVDVVVVTLERREPNLFTIPFGSYQYVAVVKWDHPWAKCSSISVNSLATERVILREATSLTRNALDRALSKAQVAIKNRVEMDSREAAREAVALGMGIGIMGAAEFVEDDPRIALLPLTDINVVLREYIACLAPRRNIRTIRAFFSVCREMNNFSETPEP